MIFELRAIGHGFYCGRPSTPLRILALLYQLAYHHVYRLL